MVFSAANTNDSKNNPLKVAVSYDFPSYNFRSTGLVEKTIDMKSNNTNNMTIDYYGTQQNYHTTSLEFNTGDIGQFKTDIPDNIGFLIISLEPTGNFNTLNSDTPEGLKMDKSIKVCFFLKNDASQQSNDIDDLLNYYDSSNTTKYTSSPTLSVNLNSVIPSQKNCYFYNSNSSTTGIDTFIFDVPIIINSKSLSQFFINNSSVYTNPGSLYKIPINSNAISTDGIYIDCNPTGESPDKLNTYNIPIGSAFDTSKGGYDLQHMTINFALFTLVLLGSYFGVPVIYNQFIIEGIKNTEKYHNSIGQELDVNDYDKKKINMYYDIFWGSIFLTHAITFISIGLTNNNYSMTSSGLFLSMFYILSVSIISTKDFNINDFRPITFSDYYNFLLGNDSILDNLWNFIMILCVYIVILYFLVMKLFNLGNKYYTFNALLCRQLSYTAS